MTIFLTGFTVTIENSQKVAIRPTPPHIFRLTPRHLFDPEILMCTPGKASHITSRRQNSTNFERKVNTLNGETLNGFCSPFELGFPCGAVHSR